MKNVFALSFAALSFLAANNALAADGTINFTGEVIDSACTVTTSNVSVDFGTVAASAFKSAGDTVSPKEFQISLTGCPAAVTASGATVRFDATPDATNPNLFSIGASSTAAGVGITVLDAKAAVVTPNSDSSIYTLAETGTNVLDFVAKLQSTSSTVTAGTISTTANFTVVYQ
ncbi:fimbrial protein [Serratia fonticola]|uniref:fimbrial protein n=1 Tax=Serratia fonticola TaxID=47917 RepID=UPI002097158C|nr:fimbrial protein [Serratia fonticola]MCO7508704.1 fimbrial protein [Serratia fonticola]MDK2376487.1 fimbrial protein [Serratia fonticola]